MMNYIWPLMMIFSVFCAVATGNAAELSNAVISGGGEGVTLAIKLLGIICFWNGLMNIAEKSGLTEIICRCFSPILSLIFPGLRDKKAKNAIAMNITANFLGLGSAATPFGLEAMKRLYTLECKSNIASNNTVRFVVMNSAALHLVPTTVALLRKEYGSTAPLSSLLPGLFTSFSALFISLILAFILEKAFPFEKKKRGGL